MIRRWTVPALCLLFVSRAGTAADDDPIDDCPAFDVWPLKYDNEAVVVDHHPVT